jgi:hypothetical protein
MSVFFCHCRSNFDVQFPFFSDLLECLLRRALRLQYGWGFDQALSVVPDGILDSAVGQVIRNARARRKAQVPLMTFALANTGDIKDVVTSRQDGFTSRMLGDRLTELSAQMASVDLPLQLKPLDVLFAQRSSSLVGTLQEIASAKSKNFTVVVSLHLSGFSFLKFSACTLQKLPGLPRWNKVCVRPTSQTFLLAW